MAIKTVIIAIYQSRCHSVCMQGIMQTVNRRCAGNNHSIHNKFSWLTLHGTTTVHATAKAGYNVLFDAAVEEASESNTE